MRARAFTLIELLVVVAIIALLISMLLPAMRGAREQAKTAVCLANQKTLAIAFVQYASDNRDAAVAATTDARGWVDWPQRENGNQLNGTQLGNIRNVDPHLRGIRRGRLFPYTKRVEVYRCPSDRRNTPNPERGNIAYRTYSMANWVNGDGGWEANIGAGAVTERVTQIRHPARSYVFVEESDPRGLNMGSWVMWLNQEQWIDPLTVWHHNKSTIGFADGHAEVHAWQDDRTLRMSREQTFYQSAEDSTDWEFMRAGWNIRPR